MLQPRAARTAGSCWRGLDIVWILCADHVFWYPWLLSTSVYRRASACCRVHHASTSSSVCGACATDTAAGAGVMYSTTGAGAAIDTGAEEPRIPENMVGTKNPDDIQPTPT